MNNLSSREPAFQRTRRWDTAAIGKARSYSQRGQALTEFVVLALVLVPLFLLTPMIGKYQDISHATQMASRYVAFDAMVRNDDTGTRKSRGQLADEVRRRFFSNSDAAIKTDDTAGNFKAHRNAFWSDQNGEPLIKDFNHDVQVSFGAGSGGDPLEGFSPASDGKAFEVSLLRLGDLGLQANGVFTANISVTLANLSSNAGNFSKSYESFNHINLVMNRHTSVLLDSWTAKDPEQTEKRIDNIKLFPGKALAAASPAIDIAVDVVESPSCFRGGCTRAPRLGKLDFWRDVVPADRLK